MARPSLSTITLGSDSNTFRTGATSYLQILMLPPKKTGGLPVALWQLHSVETGSHPHVSRLPDTVNIVVLHPGVITGTGLHQECLYKIEGTYVSGRHIQIVIHDKQGNVIRCDYTKQHVPQAPI